jgi:hypothetical protein
MPLDFQVTGLGWAQFTTIRFLRLRILVPSFPFSQETAMPTNPPNLDPENPTPENPEEDQAALEASLSSTSKAKTGGTGTIKVTG